MTYVNPVWPHSFPDPFVLKFRGEYWGYCTGWEQMEQPRRAAACRC